MADRITTNTNLVALEILTDYDVGQLTTSRLGHEDPAWSVRHDRAWDRILHELGKRRPPITESDISDTSVLAYASCYYVAHLACQQGRSDRYQKMADDFYAKFKRELAEVQIDITTGTVARTSFSFIRGLRS